MKNNRLSTYHLAKNISYEILIEEQLQLTSEAKNRLFEKYSKRRRALKLKFISYKIINAIIFGVLPIFPLMAYLDITRFFVNVPVHHQIAIFIKSLTFEIFFTLQFLDFFLMGLFNLINIMSGEIFEWFKTLPLSRMKLKKLAFFTIFHNFDLPILANIFVFPIIMFFASQNVIVFFISLGTSILNITFSISVLIILGEKIARIIKRQNVKTRKSLLIQILNTFSYVIIIFGSIIIIQMILSSLVTILVSSVNLYYSPLYNAILSLIPFPFNPSYLISLFTSTSQIPVSYWLNPLFGLGLYLIVVYVLSRKALKSLNNIISLKYKIGRMAISDKKDKLKIHTSSTIKAFIRKDLLIASRNIQTFMSFIMPIIMSFVFMIFFNISFAGGEELLSGDLFYVWVVLLGFYPVLSAMIVYNLLNMEISGKTITGALPIVIRDHAKAKLILMILIQIIAVITPTFVYIFHHRFVDLLLTVLATLPLTLIFLIFIFLLRVLLFGKKRYFYVLDEISPENKIGKWLLIFITEYAIYYCLTSLSNYIYFKFDFMGLFLTLFIITLICTVILIVLFNIFFPKFKHQYELKEKRAEYIKNVPKISIKPLISIVVCGIFFFGFFIFVLVYDLFEIPLSQFFFSSLLIITGFFLIIIFLRPSKLKHKKRLQKTSLKNKILFKKRGDIIHTIINSFLKHIIILFGVLFLNFILIRNLALNPDRYPLVTMPRYYEKDLNLPFWQHFFLYLAKLFTGNWGYLKYAGDPVKELIIERGLITLTISIIPICLALVLDIKYSFLKNHKKNQNKIIRVISLLIFSIPSYLIALLFIYYLGFETYSQLLIQLILASFILSIITLSKITFIMRRNELYIANRINPSLTQNNKYKRKNQITFKRKNFSKSFSSLNILIPSMVISEVIIIECTLSLRGLGSLFLSGVIMGDFCLLGAILFIFSITIISISFIQSLLKLYYHMKISKNMEINKPLYVFIKNKI